MKKNNSNMPRKKRTQNLVNLHKLASAVTSIPNPSKFEDYLVDKHQEFEHNGCPAQNLDDLLYDLSVDDLRTLPPAALRARELPSHGT